MRQRFTTTAFMVLGLALALLAAPQLSHAAAQITLKDVTLVGTVDTTNHTMTVRSTDGVVTTDFIVTYTLDTTATTSTGKIITVPGTRINGVPRDIIKFTEWLSGDPLTITGKIGTYTGGKLTIAATSIDYQLRGVTTKTFVGTVDNKNSATGQLSVTIKPGPLYVLTQVNKIGQSGGPSLNGAADVNSIALGSTVKLVQVWRPDPTTGKSMKFKDLSVTMLVTPPPPTVVRVLRLTQTANDGPINITAGFPQPLTLISGNKIALQNETTKTIYLKVADSDRASYTTNLTNGYAMVRAGGIATLTTKAPVTIGNATFSQPINTLRTLAVARRGDGNVSAKTANETLPSINCGSICKAPFADGAIVTLTATKGTRTTFTGWSGSGCSGTDTCTITMTADKSVTAIFDATASSYNITVTKVGNGTIVSGETTPKINCGTQCSTNLATNSNLTLTATPAPGYIFTGWSGACSGTATCAVTIDRTKMVTATFSLPMHTISVTRSGGAGEVSSTPVGLSCTTATTCSGSFTEGTTVYLRAPETPAPNLTGCYHLSSWGGACSGTRTVEACKITMTDDKSVTATFTYGLCIE